MLRGGVFGFGGVGQSKTKQINERTGEARIVAVCDVSETARRLNMHRRTLQRILAKRAPK
jgi:ActR/RegA family two-component response regulator